MDIDRHGETIPGCFRKKCCRVVSIDRNEEKLIIYGGTANRAYTFDTLSWVGTALGDDRKLNICNLNQYKQAGTNPPAQFFFFCREEPCVLDGVCLVDRKTKDQTNHQQWFKEINKKEERRPCDPCHRLTPLTEHHILDRLIGVDILPN